MKTIRKKIRPASIYALIFFVLIPTFGQSACAAMIATETVLKSDRRQEMRDYLQSLISRERIREILVARGINPQEAGARIECLTDDEIDLISDQIADLPAGGGAWGFVWIVGAIILILILVVEYTSEVKMFPQLYSSD